MKKQLITLSIVATVLLSQSAFADGRYHSRAYDRWGPASYYRSGYGQRYYGSFYGNTYRNRYFNNYRPYRRDNFVSVSYGSGPWAYGAYYGRGYYGRNYRRYDAGDFLGGLVVGSLLTSSYQSSRDYGRVVYRSTPVTRTREVVVDRSSVSRTVSSATPRAQGNGRRLLRDLNGNCFEITYNGAGDELRQEIDPSLCEF